MRVLFSNAVKTLAVIGGGPAGSTVAETLARRGIRVVIFEEKLGWEKPCGGGLSHKALRRYPVLLEASEPHQCVRDAEFVASNGSAVRFRLREPLVIYSRATLNQLLLNRARAAGAEVIQDRIHNLRREGDTWTLKGRSGTYQADSLVLAAGARSRLRSVLTEDFSADDFMLTFGYYVPGADDLLRVQFFGEFEGYAWAFPRPGHLSVGICGKVGEDRMSGLRERLHGFMERFGYSADGATVYAHLLPSLAIERWNNLRLAGDGWALAGDAAGLVDPVTGEGIYYAIRSGELLGEALLENAPAAYAERVREEFSSLTLGARIAPILYHGDFLGAASTTRLIEFAARSRTFMDMLQDVIEGSQSYSGLGTRLYRSLAISLAEITVGALRGVLENLSLGRGSLPAAQRPALDGRRMWFAADPGQRT